MVERQNIMRQVHPRERRLWVLSEEKRGSRIRKDLMKAQLTLLSRLPRKTLRLLRRVKRAYFTAEENILSLIYIMKSLIKFR